ncbi:FecR family protein [Sinomicrobium weinanense]|uniref:FecR domain-containing protein n=1 Tax=Sinomicrobium weinanense TaxID=2842200 RepID=A0A926JSA7_9FLAO|nr:FecR domain-containing protein [Sinomicrobium weinanense]MBC9796558.1 FecR domain-containing protein [Sinomicrobium weinanense]MBU3123055.1 FecR domain-containing protein [Sinomicrobium weinanense]
MKDRPDQLIERFLQDKLSPKEEKELREWLETPGGRQFLKKEIQLHHLVRATLHSFDGEKAYGQTSRLVQKAEKKHFCWRTYLRYAAVLVIALGCGYFLYTHLSSNTKEQLVISDEKITLELEDGSIRTITPGEPQQITTGKGKAVATRQGDTLYYSSGLPENSLLFNILRVPYGKTFKLKLSDGTMAHLNAGTSLRYPVKFSGRAREVFLEGEAFFDVSENKDRPFLVRTGNMDIEVTGTRFNVSAYEDDPETSVVLAGGAITIHSTGRSGKTGTSATLSPGQRGALARGTSRIDLREVDVEDYIAWMDGKVIFYNKAFKDVLKILERKYNVTIKNDYPELNKERFKAIFDDETIEQVLRTFTESRLFSYRIRNNIIVIEKPEE